MAIRTAEDFWPELEAMGEDKVRAQLATEAIYGADKRTLVVEWLRRKDQERSDAVKREEISIARDAASAARDSADAARDAAREARTANINARIAIAIAAIAVIVSVIALFQK